MKFVVEFEGKYLIRTPYWDSGIWTEDKNKATVYEEDLEFFKEYYPQFNVVEICK